jgi:hypothetical protein
MSDNYLHSDITQLIINYLKATEIEVGLLLNFGKEAELKRKVFSLEYKNLKTSSPS